VEELVSVGSVVTVNVAGQVSKWGLGKMESNKQKKSVYFIFYYLLVLQKWLFCLTAAPSGDRSASDVAGVWAVPGHSALWAGGLCLDEGEQETDVPQPPQNDQLLKQGE
jgi:hypothetical protein